MSNHIASQIWNLRGIPPSTKFVLIKLADNASDDGVCWPSVPRMAAECELSERTVQAAIIWGEKHGILRRDMRSGRSTIYHITPAGFTGVTPAIDGKTPAAAAPPQDLHPAIHDATPAGFAPPPPQSVQAPPQSTTSTVYRTSIREPSVEPSREPTQATRARTTTDQVLKNDQEGFAGREHPPPLEGPPGFSIFWELFPAGRRGNRAAALTEYARILRENQATEEEIHAGTRRYAGSDEVQRKILSRADNWLSRDGWKRDYDPPATGKSDGRAPRKPAGGLTDYERIILAGLNG